jgi:hypothetical protein
MKKKLNMIWHLNLLTVSYSYPKIKKNSNVTSKESEGLRESPISVVTTISSGYNGVILLLLFRILQ